MRFSTRVALGPRRALLAVTAAAALAAATNTGCGDAAREGASGVRRLTLAPTRGYLLISIDTLRADRLSSYGYHRTTTPFLDALARQAVVFDNAIAPLPGTLPSHLSMLTGLYPEEHDVFPPHGSLSPAIQTLPELLEQAGFLTAGHTEGGYVSGEHGFARGFSEWCDDRSGRTSIERTTQRGLDFLARVGESPFFLFLHTYVVHTPYWPPEPYRFRFWQREPLAIPSNDDTVAAVNAGQLRLSEAEVDYLSALYDGGVNYADEVLRRFVAGLDELGLRPHTTIVITADHGEELLEHGKLAHEQIYRETLRVPLLVLHPDLRDGRRISTAVELIDLAPTILDLAGLSFARTVSGRSLVPWLTGAAAADAPGEAYSIDFSRQWSSLYRLDASGLHHLLVDRRGPSPRVELFDVARDPLERVNVAATHPTRTQELLAALGAFRLRPVAHAGTIELSPDRESELRALGYLR